MIAILQRVRHAKVEVAGQVIGAIGPGLLMLICAEPGDSEVQAEKMIHKVLKLRIFSDASAKMNLSLQDVGGGLLIVSQFTLAADCSGGNRPSFTGAARPEAGQRLYDHCLSYARGLHPEVAGGEFGADMQLSLLNDGPVTIPLRIN
ncbi:D-tyrosyl-tRNA(Tyr) deacylase [Paucibacter sp. B2R-40]|uniref:D-aminoacyl-tRNA deacylase n=1 Tax=Paucibacter sp. B2R-40 TaxID=2893554 RepID=UPI0021E4E395|nr:D-aminoacyl-tRNA deacylase [Paucibacter sp. B2R-40]MCV2356660.1 D-tyrosyl-tRNA(Tyr) deacylase [Paucibacter sp. B2R-40]